MSNKAYVYDPITREFVGVARLVNRTVKLSQMTE